MDHRIRMAMQSMHFDQSRQLLLELCTLDPTVQHCFRIIESMCLSQGIDVAVSGKPATARFKDHIVRQWFPFVRQSIRAMHSYGFVPWRLRRVSSGDWIPEVLPAGTFTWTTELGDSDRDKRSRGSMYPPRKSPPTDAADDDATLLVKYHVRPSVGNLTEDDIHVYSFVPATLNVSSSSEMYSTVSSPLSHVLSDYKFLRAAQLRRANADAWNTTARVMCTFRPNIVVEDNPTQYLMDFVHEEHFRAPAFSKNITPMLSAYNHRQRDSAVKEVFVGPTNHNADVFTLPRDHDVKPQFMLTPCEDINFLYDKFRRDVCAVLGVPFEMITSQSSGNESVRKTIASGRVFTSTMDSLCSHVQDLLSIVYAKIYRVERETVTFSLNPMPRLEVESIEDFKILFDIGALTPDQSIKISQMLIGAKTSAYQKAIDSTLAAGEQGGFGNSSGTDPKQPGKEEKKQKYNAGGGGGKKEKSGEPKFI